jgi:hypothetical protein
MHALFRNFGGGNEKSQYGKPVLQQGIEPGNTRIQSLERRCYTTLFGLTRLGLNGRYTPKRHHDELTSQTTRSSA